MKKSHRQWIGLGAWFAIVAAAVAACSGGPRAPAPTQQASTAAPPATAPAPQR